MPRILVIAAHPDMAHSRITRALLDAARRLPEDLKLRLDAGDSHSVHGSISSGSTTQKNHTGWRLLNSVPA